MTSHPYTEHEKYANQADDYLDQHNVYELFGSLLRNLVLHKPKDPLSFMIDALEQPVQQVRTGGRRSNKANDRSYSRQCRPRTPCV